MSRLSTALSNRLIRLYLRIKISCSLRYRPHKNEKMTRLAFCCNRRILTEGRTDKNPPRTKPSRPKLPDKSPRELRHTPCKDTCTYACRPTTKNWEVSEMCDKV